MSKISFAKLEPVRSEAPDAGQLRDMIIRIVMEEYSGDVVNEFWTRPARAAANRIGAAIYSGPRPGPTIP
jgi:hypothetical protein